jgi:hypothetical protein
VTWNRGKPLGARQLAKLLEPYGIKTKNLKFGLYQTLKGFELAQFEDAFARYLAPSDLPLFRERALDLMGFPVSGDPQPKSAVVQIDEDADIF